MEYSYHAFTDSINGLNYSSNNAFGLNLGLCMYEKSRHPALGSAWHYLFSLLPVPLSPGTEI